MGLHRRPYWAPQHDFQQDADGHCQFWKWQMKCESDLWVLKSDGQPLRVVLELWRFCKLCKCLGSLKYIMILNWLGDHVGSGLVCAWGDVGLMFHHCFKVLKCKCLFQAEFHYWGKQDCFFCILAWVVRKIVMSCRRVPGRFWGTQTQTMKANVMSCKHWCVCFVVLLVETCRATNNILCWWCPWYPCWCIVKLSAWQGLLRVGRP